MTIPRKYGHSQQDKKEFRSELLEMAIDHLNWAEVTFTFTDHAGCALTC